MKKSASYTRAVALLSSNARDAQFPTTGKAAFVSNLFLVGFDRLFRDVNRYRAEKKAAAKGWRVFRGKKK